MLVHIAAAGSCKTTNEQYSAVMIPRQACPVGSKQPSASFVGISALHLKADITRVEADVCFVPVAEVVGERRPSDCDFCFAEEADIAGGRSKQSLRQKVRSALPSKADEPQ